VQEVCSKMAIIEGGRVLYEGPPGAAVDAIRGRIWTREIQKAELPAFRERMRVLSTRLKAGRTLIRVFSDERPDESFAEAQADLGDVYFHTLTGPRNGNGRDA